MRNMRHILISILFLLSQPFLAFADGGLQTEMGGVGIPAEGQQILGETRGAALSAAATPTPVSSTVNVFTTVTAGSLENTKLPLKTAIKRDDITIVNNGAGSLNVYPPTDGSINNLGTNVPLTIGSGSSAYFRRTSLTGWTGIVSAIGARSPNSYRVVYVPTMAATPAAGTNDIKAGYFNAIPTAAANTAACLPAVPTPGSSYQGCNEGPNAVRVKACGTPGINGAAAGTYLSVATKACFTCDAPTSAAYDCQTGTVPTPAGP